MAFEKKDIIKLTDHLFRENSGKMVAVLSRLFGLQHLDQIMDVVQDTFETALQKWKYSGVPENPSAWLMQVAKNRAINVFKKESRMWLTEPQLMAAQLEGGLTVPEAIDRHFLGNEPEDSQLRLLLTCCHPDFSDKNQIILTLNILSGFGVSEIANAMLMKDEAVKKALSRSKARLKEKKSILETPLLPKDEKRVHTVHTILYLIYNEGYKTTRASEVLNHDLCYEAMRLTKILLKKGVALKHQSEALLALMFFNLARFAARLGTEGEMINLAKQDRSQWNTTFIQEGRYYLNNSIKAKNISRYHIEAIIASLHCSAKSFEETDWQSISRLYEQLETVSPSPMVRLLKLVTKSYTDDAGQILPEIELLKKGGQMNSHYLLFAAEADLLKRVGKIRAALEAYERAEQLTSSHPDKVFLQAKVAKCKSLLY